MRVFTVFSITYVIMCISACKTTPPLKVTGAWANNEKMQPGKYKSVFLLVLTPNFEARQIIENEFASAAAQKGITAVKSVDIYPPFNSKESTPSDTMILRKAVEKGCETIFVTMMVDEKSETKYVPGSSGYYNPYSYGGMYGGMYGYGTFPGYYGFYANIASSPGYYSTDKTFYLESNLYDVKTGDHLMSFQSKAFNPPQIQTSGPLYARQLVEEMQRMGFNGAR